MKNKLFSRYYLFACVGVLIASYYPLSMGVRVITDMIADGTVLKENYPQYIIPHTPRIHIQQHPRNRFCSCRFHHHRGFGLYESIDICFAEWLPGIF